MNLKKKQHNKWILVILVVLGCSIWLWDGVIKDRVIPKRWGIVKQGKVYRSGQLSASLVEKTLKKNDIKVIVSLTGKVPDDPDQAAEQCAADKLDIDLFRFGLGGDGTGDIEQYAQAIAVIVKAEKENKPVQVHCAAGTQRTGGVIACYRLLVKGDAPKDVLREMKLYGWSPQENPKLLPFINKNMYHLAERLQELGVIDTIPEPLPLL